ncbi:CDP-diacylglycerol--glycerol-3-phosphate 3-phosphatidyltransferase [Candidatus Methylacidithermus pantelleriae]|uniref:CDP-diacylglycerol--glycerol-3-phosphate 3-phosphatidyltransferase n=1 Tax=Candidatus Methylacidithermus pantelleriae TaxID=2744239 RepID=A0A8J2BUX3_9BACT|nr:CDP-diacylglycerol--glycerol-3-phosphate 3-phosphatidyltransferase [Candidatus Methylacidithermus pantelleriae]CAF0700844.1 CDP-diacylglycerol--glycerol-3-phosphate 3-phosphatidyltransferase [Candidatus Methylacidithermus pantelleriae]
MGGVAHDRQLPNKLSLGRLLLSAAFVADLSSSWPFKATAALGIFVVGSLTDWLDGWIARTRQWESDLGKLLDPLADKILITAAFIALLELGYAPMWVVVAIVSREFLITGLRTLAATRGFVLGAEKAGKHKTLSQILFVLACLTDQSLQELGAQESFLSRWLQLVQPPLLWIVLCITVASGLIYLVKNRGLFLASDPVPPIPASSVKREAVNCPAFKEWEAVVKALGSGHQSLLLRKGGLGELRRGFQVQHQRFWLLPTRFHQAQDKLKPPFASWVSRDEKPTEILLEYVAEVKEATFLTDWDHVEALDPFHIWATETVREKFFCGPVPGVHCLFVRVFRADPPVRIPWHASYEGCRSWTEVPASWERSRLIPVLTEEEFRQLLERISGLVRV